MLGTYCDVAVTYCLTRVIFVSSDDKQRCVVPALVLKHITDSNIAAIICLQVNIGEPHLPINITQRGKASICPQFMIDEGHFAADDHEFHCVNFTPNVNLVVDIEDPDIFHDEDVCIQSYYKGMLV